LFGVRGWFTPIDKIYSPSLQPTSITYIGYKMASSTSRRRVLITGVCGLVGRVFFDYLTKTHPTKYEVFGIDLHLNVSSRYRSQNNNDSLKSQWSPPEHRFFQCDVTDRIKFHRIIEEQQIEMIVHLAAVLEDDPDVDKITRVNIEGTRNAFEARQ
jgi:nucleoside-diphosphate-sugar epimerase